TDALDIKVPYRFTPRDYQADAWRAMHEGCRRAVWIWHRRAGKDKTAFNFMIERAVVEPGVYYYFLPTYAQGKRVLWDGIVKDETGAAMRMLDHVPPELILKTIEDEMQITLRTVDSKVNSIIQVIGTDKIDTIRGTNPIGCVFSEYAIGRPGVWDVIE